MYITSYLIGIMYLHVHTLYLASFLRIPHTQMSKERESSPLLAHSGEGLGTRLHFLNALKLENILPCNPQQIVVHALN